MSFSKFLVEEKYLAKIDYLVEFFGMNAKAGIEKAAKELLDKKNIKDEFFSIFANTSLDLLVQVLESRLKDSRDKYKASYMLYIMFKFYGKNGGFFRFSTGTQAKELLKNRDEDIKRGAEKAKADLEAKININKKL